VTEFMGWMAHDAENRVVVLYASHGDSRAQQVKYLTSVLRRGLVVRRIISEDIRAYWGQVITERAMKRVAAPPDYDDDDGSAVDIAEGLVRRWHP
jgi:hypothetical protein